MQPTQDSALQDRMNNKSINPKTTLNVPYLSENILQPKTVFVKEGQVFTRRRAAYFSVHLSMDINR